MVSGSVVSYLLKRAFGPNVEDKYATLFGR
jgi:hypothetical protein